MVAAGMVGGGSGLNGEYGLRKITANTPTKTTTTRIEDILLKSKVLDKRFFGMSVIEETSGNEILGIDGKFKLDDTLKKAI